MDFGAIRIHTDDLAAESARAVNARAYTVGTHVVFNTGAFAPRTAGGRRLLAHELTHVVQNGSALVARTPDDPPMKPWSGHISESVWSAALRSSPGGTTVADLPGRGASTAVTVIAKSGGWLLVKASVNGKSLTGYVSGELITRTEAVADATGTGAASAEVTLDTEDDLSQEGLIALGNVLKDVAAPESGHLRGIYKKGMEKIHAQHAEMLKLGKSEAEIAEKLATMRTQLAHEVRAAGSKLMKVSAEFFDAARGNKERPGYTQLRKTKTDAQIIKSATQSNKFINRLPKTLKWTGRGLWFVSGALSFYVILEAPEEERFQTIDEEVGGLIGGAIGSILCLASGMATGGVGLIVCGLLGAGGAALGSQLSIGQLLDITPHDVPSLAGKMYRVHGETGELDFFLFSVPGKEITENILVIHTGKVSGEKISGRGHHRDYWVEPANPAAIKFFGDNKPHWIPKYQLKPATSQDLLESE
ncbi:MAG: DUF4157 domain-containing protein [Acidobacteriota bacterium]|nr:DUF4157 domain-containing protein [Acidobacteriota bacterium]